MNQKLEHELAHGSIGRLMARFGIPSVVAMLVNALYNILDQVFIGWGVGWMGNGAANVVLLFTLITLSLSLLLGNGAAAQFSLRLGRGEQEQAAVGVGSALAAIVVVSLTVSAMGFVFLEPILRLFGATEALMPMALDYGKIIVLGTPFIMISTTLNAVIRADGSPRFAMFAMIFGAVFNTCLDVLFIFGFGWGVKGAAASTFLGQLATFCISLAYLGRFQAIRLTARLVRIRLKETLEVCALGISSFIDQISFTLVMAVNNNLIVHYGAMTAYGSEAPLAAYGIAMKVQEILFTVLLGIAIGMQPIVGFNYGAKNYDRVKKTYALAVAVGTVVSVAATALFVLWPDAVIGLFGVGDPVFLAFSRQFFKTYFLLYIFFGFQTITGVFFQAIGKPAQAATLSLSYQLGLKIVSAVALSATMGLGGVLWSGPVADGAVFILTLTLVAFQWRKLK